MQRKNTNEHAADEGGLDVGHHACRHERDDQQQREHRIGRALGAGQVLVEFSRQIEHDEVAGLAWQPADRLPGADQEHGVADVDLLLAQPMGLEGRTSAPHPDYRELIARQLLPLYDGLADEARGLRDHHLQHADSLGLVQPRTGEPARTRTRYSRSASR